LIEAEHLTKYYGRFLAIEDVSFNVRQGEIVGFLGPNGAGKTTTLRILAGFMPPSRGTARVAGYDLLSQSLEARRHIGYLPETVPLYKDMTVSSYLRFSATIRGLRGGRRNHRIKDVLNLCRIEEYAHTQIAKLSKGFRQLVGIAQAVIHEPRVLILDEPTIGIDPRQVVQIRQLIQQLGQEHTIILSSHILPEVSMICKRIIVLDQGRVVAVDDTENLLKGLQKVQRIEIEAEGPPENALGKLKQIEGVQRVTAEDTNETVLFTVECLPDRDFRGELAETIVGSGLTLLGLKVREMSLEDIFLKLTTKGSRKNNFTF
jgi:ABC-2 type transport system ATP-binding protein